jgi:hypothetical protein
MKTILHKVMNFIFRATAVGIIALVFYSAIRLILETANLI